MENKIISYKGFNKELKCRGFQYEVGQTFTHKGEVKQCSSGFHACPTPIDVFRYYPPAVSRYCVVEQTGEMDESDDKIVSSVLTVKAELNTLDIVKAQIECIKNHLKIHDQKSNTGHYLAVSNTLDYSTVSNIGDCSTASSTGNYSAVLSTGDCSAASNTGHYSAASNTGDCSTVSNTGDCSTASSTGDCSTASSTGNYSAVLSTGDCSAASNTGHYSAASSTGNYSAVLSTGDCSAAAVEGENSVAIVTGDCSAAKASAGSWIVVTEYNDNHNIVNIKAAQAGIDVEPDTYYKLVDGEFVKCEDK